MSDWLKSNCKMSSTIWMVKSNNLNANKNLLWKLKLKSKSKDLRHIHISGDSLCVCVCFFIHSYNLSFSQSLAQLLNQFNVVLCLRIFFCFDCKTFPASIEKHTFWESNIKKWNIVWPSVLYEYYKNKKLSLINAIIKHLEL